MNKTILYIIVLLALMGMSLRVHALVPDDSDANFVGHVVNKSTQEHVPFVTLSLRNTAIKTMTDETGHFFLANLPEGTFVRR